MLVNFPSMIMKNKLGLALCLTLLLLAVRAQTAEVQTQERLSLDPGWRFNLGDIPFPVIQGHDATYNNAKAGKAWGAAAPEFDDSKWRSVNLPHDWVVEGPFDPKENVSQGYRPRGIAWYRRHFKLPASDHGRHIELQFDGVATHCTVWVNGILAHRNWCGYTSFAIDITPFAKYGDAVNSVVVRVDANVMEGWWYEGGGIYRHTWIAKRDPVHIATDGVFANPVKQADGTWLVPVEATLNSSARASVAAEVEATLMDPDGTQVAQAVARVNVAPFEDTVAKLPIKLAAPRLWSVEKPVLYSLRTVVKQDGKSGDTVTTRCGFRTIRFDADKGFFLNDQPVKLKGVCNHQDHAGVGVAIPDSLWEFRLRKLKEMGVNAYRCSHNPPSVEFLDLCDQLGLLVMDENRNFNSTPEYLRQLEWMVRRDRNHPSIILWSVFNEEPMQGTESGYEMVRRMSAAVKRLDTSRPVTAAMNGGQFTRLNVAHAVDVVGFNYSAETYDRFHEANKTLPMTSSEDTSAFMTRGEYNTDKQRNIMGSYDDQRAPWGATHRAAWKAIGERPFVAGGFIWTGFDYHGEPTPNQWPSASSVFGCLDLCGFPKAAFYMHQAHWLESKPVLQIVPHWNWPGQEGKPVKVMAIANAQTVALSLNGQALGEKAVDKYDFVTWEVPYAPGRLEAIGKKDGKEVSRCVVETTGEPVALQLLPDRSSLAGDGWDAQPVTVQAVDAQGRLVPTANLMVEFELSGPGAIIGLGNGDPNSHEAEKGNRRSLFNGLAQVIMQSQPGGSGTLTLVAKSSGLKSAEVGIKVESVPARPAVGIAQTAFELQNWRLSPASATPPDPNQRLADNDMNSWAPVEAGKLQSLAGGNYVVYRTQFELSHAVNEVGGKIAFKSITGKAEVWLDGKLLGKKDKFSAGSLTLPLPTGKGNRTLSVLIETEPGKSAGFGKAVAIEPK